MSNVDYYFTRLIEQAKNGDRDDAISLLREFTQLHENAEHIPAPLMAYVAECIATWLNSECKPMEATQAFNVQRPAHRDNSGETHKSIASKRIKVLRTYYLMRGRYKGRNEAIKIAATRSGVSESTVIKLIAPSYGGMSAEQAVALSAMGERIEARCLNPRRKKYQRTR